MKVKATFNFFTFDAPRHAALLALVTCASTGCGNAASAGSSTSDDAGTFVPVTSTFEGFHTWTSFPATPPAGAPGDGVHSVTGTKTLFINQLPPAGSTEYPVGTVIVKEPDGGDPATRQIFAMVKVGGGYNSGGAHNWKWFELANLVADGGIDGVQILWDGPAPPAGDTYVNDAGTNEAGIGAGDCNGCHSMASKSDFVWSSTLPLYAP